MSALHKLFATVVILALALAIAIPAATRVERWPLLAYPMYSRVMGMGKFIAVRVYGVPADTTLRRFYIDDPRAIHPFSLQRLSPSIGRLVDAGKQDSVTGLRFVFENYEQRRRAGLHDGPALGGIALYGFEWHLDRGLRTVGEPYQTVLMLELDADGNEVRQ